jgi:putative tributyrin esterase
MAYISLSFYSKSLCRPVPVTILLPNDAREWYLNNNPEYDRPPKTLFLLHGYSGDDKDWITGSNIVDLSFKYNMAVILPNAENGFYLDGKATGYAYGTFLGAELVEYMRRTFSLALKKEDTFAAGFSMGGFGALHTVLKYPETFSRGTGLSSANIVHTLAHMKPGTENGIANYEYYTQIFGNLETVEDSENNPEVLVRQIKKRGGILPDIFMACGTEDFLIEQNRQTRDFFISEGLNVSYHESSGQHNMIFWNEYIEPAVKWMLGQQ